MAGSGLQDTWRWGRGRGAIGADGDGGLQGLVLCSNAPIQAAALRSLQGATIGVSLGVAADSGVLAGAVEPVVTLDLHAGSRVEALAMLLAANATARVVAMCVEGAR